MECPRISSYDIGCASTNYFPKKLIRVTATINFNIYCDIASNEATWHYISYLLNKCILVMQLSNCFPFLFSKLCLFSAKLLFMLFIAMVQISIQWVLHWCTQKYIFFVINGYNFLPFQDSFAKVGA